MGQSNCCQAYADEDIQICGCCGEHCVAEEDPDYPPCQNNNPDVFVRYQNFFAECVSKITNPGELGESLPDETAR